MDGFPRVKAVHDAKDPVEALRMFRELQPDVVIMDVHRRGGGGIDFLRRLKASQGNPSVIVLTNESCDQYRKPCMDDFFFDKSTEFDEVARVLRKIVGAFLQTGAPG